MAYFIGIICSFVNLGMLVSFIRYSVESLVLGHLSHIQVQFSLRPRDPRKLSQLASNYSYSKTIRLKNKEMYMCN